MKMQRACEYDTRTCGLKPQTLSMERCAVQALRTGAATCQQLARCGLLALALRALAAADPPLRALAYDAVALATSALEAEDFRCAACVLCIYSHFSMAPVLL